MSTRIGLISDVHATPGPVEEALMLFESEAVDQILCPGDIAGYGNELAPTVDLLMAHNCLAVQGNHEIWYLEKHAEESASLVSRWFASLPRTLEMTFEGLRLYMVHASPPDSYKNGIRLLDLEGEIIDEEKAGWTERLEGFEHDVLIVGHTHQIFCQHLGETLVINPGSTCFNHACAILTFPDLTLEVFGLSGKQPCRSWNWGMGLDRDSYRN